MTVPALLLASWLTLTASRPIDTKDVQMPIRFVPPIPRDRELLAQYLDHNDRRIRSEAAWAIGDSQAVELVPILARRLSIETNEWVRADLLQAMGKLHHGGDPLLVATRLNDPDAVVRRWAVWALAQWRATNAAPSLAERALRDEDESVRRDAAKALGRLDGEAAETALARATADASPRVREEALRALGELWQLGETGLQALLSALHDPDPLARAAAVASLGRVDNFAVQSPVAEMAADEHPFVRREAARSLRLLCATEHVQTVLRLLADSDMAVRMEAAATLAWLRDRTAIDPLLARLGDPDRFVRRAAATALVNLEMTDLIVPKLTRALANESAPVRREAAWALGEYRDRRPALTLCETTSDPDQQTVLNAIEALGKIADRRAVETLISRLQHELPAARAMAAWALGEIRDRRATDPLIPILTDPFPEPRLQAATAAGRIRDERFVLPLIQVLRNVTTELSTTRAAAAWSLGQLADDRAVPRLRQMLSEKVVPTPMGPVFDSEPVRMNSAVALTRIARSVRGAGQLEPTTRFLTEQFSQGLEMSDHLKECLAECLYALTGRTFEFDRQPPMPRSYFVRSIEGRD